MTLLLLSLLIFVRIAAASWGNVLQKRAIHNSLPLGSAPSSLELLVAIWTWITIVLLPWWLGALLDTDFADNVSGGNVLGLAFWGWMTLACLLEVPGNALLLRSLQRTDLSIFGPLNSYKPIVGMLLGWWILAEVPTPLGLVGMAIVLAGSLLLAGRGKVMDQAANQRRYILGLEHRGVRDRLIAVALTAAASVFLKLGIEQVDATTSLAVWSFLSWLLAVMWLLIQAAVRGFRHASLPPEKRQRKSTLRRTLRLCLAREPMLIALSMLLMQGATIAVFQRVAVGYALAFFQLGSLLSVYLGHRLFGEADFFRRLLAAIVMVVGAILIMLAG